MNAAKEIFSGCIDRANSQQHLDSHRAFVRAFEQSCAPFGDRSFTDRLLNLLRHRCFQQFGPLGAITTLKAAFQAPEIFQAQVTFGTAGKEFIANESITTAEINRWPLTHNPILTTNRLEIGLLSPSEEPAIVNTIADSQVWQMRGERYTPIFNIHAECGGNEPIYPWYKYYFAVRLRPDRIPIGFVGFYQISRPSAIGSAIAQMPYDPAMLSYALAPQYWGQGLMSEALTAALPWFVNHRLVREVVAFAEVNNRGSRHILQKLGLHECGVLKDPAISADLKGKYQFAIYKLRNEEIAVKTSQTSRF